RADLLIGPHQRAVWIVLLTGRLLKALADVDLQAVDAVRDLGSHRLTAGRGAGAAVDADRKRHAVLQAGQRIPAGRPDSGPGDQHPRAGHYALACGIAQADVEIGSSFRAEITDRGESVLDRD